MVETFTRVGEKNTVVAQLVIEGPVVWIPPPIVHTPNPKLLPVRPGSALHSGSRPLVYEYVREWVNVRLIVELFEHHCRVEKRYTSTARWPLDPTHLWQLQDIKVFCQVILQTHMRSSAHAQFHQDQNWMFRQDNKTHVETVQNLSFKKNKQTNPAFACLCLVFTCCNSIFDSHFFYSFCTVGSLSLVVSVFCK